MKNGEVIARAKRDQNLFIFDLAQPRRAMTIVKNRPKAMAITGKGRTTYLVSQNKRIQLWHRQLEHIRKARVVRASKLVDGIDLDMKNKEYNLAEVLFDSDNSNNSEKFNPNNDKAFSLINTSVLSPKIVVIRQTTSDPDILDKLCLPCIGSKLS